MAKMDWGPLIAAPGAHRPHQRKCSPSSSSGPRTFQSPLRMAVKDSTPLHPILFNLVPLNDLLSTGQDSIRSSALIRNMFANHFSKSQLWEIRVLATFPNKSSQNQHYRVLIEETSSSTTFLFYLVIFRQLLCSTSYGMKSVEKFVHILLRYC